jgi:hypothetical protein
MQNKPTFLPWYPIKYDAWLGLPPMQPRDWFTEKHFYKRNKLQHNVLENHKQASVYTQWTVFVVWSLIWSNY